MSATFGLPKCVHDWAVIAANLFAVPHPRLWIDGLANRAKQFHAGQIMRGGKRVAPFHERANGGGGGMEMRDLVSLHNAPEAIFLGRVGRAFIHERGHAVGKNSVDHIAVTGDPTNVGGAPKNLAGARQ